MPVLGSSVPVGDLGVVVDRSLARDMPDCCSTDLRPPPARAMAMHESERVSHFSLLDFWLLLLCCNTRQGCSAAELQVFACMACNQVARGHACMHAGARASRPDIAAAVAKAPASLPWADPSRRIEGIEICNRLEFR